MLGAFSLPLAFALVNGQDTPLPRGNSGASVSVWMRRGRDVVAGAVLSLCAIKFHMFLLLPVVLLVHRRWQVLKGGLIGGLILLAISFLSEGVRWPMQYARLLLSSELDPCIDLHAECEGSG